MAPPRITKSLAALYRRMRKAWQPPPAETTVTAEIARLVEMHNQAAHVFRVSAEVSSTALASRLDSLSRRLSFQSGVLADMVRTLGGPAHQPDGFHDLLPVDGNALQLAQSQGAEAASRAVLEDLAALEGAIHKVIENNATPHQVRNALARAAGCVESAKRGWLDEVKFESPDRVDEAGLESFPCNDPPAWTLGTREP